jgi:hypothetical protein
VIDILNPVAGNITIWRVPVGSTITKIWGNVQAGTSVTFNVSKGTVGTPTNYILTSDGTTRSDYALATLDAWTDAVATGGKTLHSTQKALAAGDNILVIIASVSGAVTQFAVQIEYTVP